MLAHLAGKSKSGIARQTAAAPRAILFDWDNTLVDNWAAIHAAMNVTLGRFGQAPWTVEQCKARVKTSLRDAFPRLFAGQSDLALPTYLDAFERIHLQHLAEMPAAGAMLDAAQEIGLYLGSRQQQDRAQPAAGGGASRLDAALLPDRRRHDAARDKPAPDPVHLALGGSGVAPGRMSGSSATPTSTCSAPAPAAARRCCSIWRHRRREMARGRAGTSRRGLRRLRAPLDDGLPFRAELLLCKRYLGRVG